DARRRPPAPWRRCATRWRAKWLRPWAIRRRYAARPISIRGSSRHGRRAAWAGPRRVRAGRASGNGPPAASCAARSGPRSPAADDRDAQQAARPRVTIRPGIRDTDGIMRLRVVFGLVLLALACAAPAQQLPRPAEFYFDEDERIARPLVAVEGDDEAAQEQLLRMIQRNDRNRHTAQAQLARIAMEQGRPELGRGLYGQLLDDMGRHALRPSVHWNYGWDLYRDGDVEGALEQWLAASSSRPRYPEWVPATFALALWRLDRRDEARDWYAAAVRTWP